MRARARIAELPFEFTEQHLHRRFDEGMKGTGRIGSYRESTFWKESREGKDVVSGPPSGTDAQTRGTTVIG